MIRRYFYDLVHIILFKDRLIVKTITLVKSLTLQNYKIQSIYFAVDVLYFILIKYLAY